MASHEGSRKRIKISRTESKPSSSTMASTSISASTQACQSAGESACSHEPSLKALQTDVDAMRQIVTCKICQRLLYEPYSLACGHTYCYSCLSQWIVGKPKKTCPDCRAVVNQQPTPSYLIRELVLIFVSRNELLPDGETTEEHDGLVKEEAEAVAKDKANTDPRRGGLFKGCFKKGLRGYIGPIHDPGDNVYRCPTCNWELEEGFCNQCGEMADPHEHFDFSDYDSDLTDDDLDHELDAEDAAAVFGADGQDDLLGLEAHDLLTHDGGPHSRSANRADRRRVSFGPGLYTHSLSSDDENDSLADDEDEGNLTGFVVDDGNIEYASSEEGEHNEISSPPAGFMADRRRRARAVVISDDEDDATPSVNPTSELSEDSDDESPVAVGSQRHHRGRADGRLQRARRAVLSDEESSTHDEEEEDRQDAFTANGGFSPLDSSVTGDYEASYRNGYDSDDVSTVHPMDNEDGYMYHNGEDEHVDESDESDESDNGFGWGTRGETPTNHRELQPRSTHRLNTLGRRNDRHADFAPVAPIRNMLSSSDRYARPRSPDIDRHSTLTSTRAQSHNSRPHTTSLRASDTSIPSSSRSHGMFRAQPAAMTLPSHPFTLGNTLNSVNDRTNSHSRNYNQRNQHVRSNPLHRAASAASSQSSPAGGVDLRGSSSGGSSSTLRQETASSRRKRLLSVSSDGSVEEVRQRYDY